MLRLVQSALKRVRDTFAAGAAERRFAQLESEARDLMHEFNEVLTKAARRAATEARAKNRALRAEEVEERRAEAPAVSTAQARAEWKAQMRTRLSARGSRALRDQYPQQIELPTEETGT